MFIDLSDKSVVIVGGGSTAVRRTRTLLQFARNVTVIAKDAAQELIDMEKLGKITLHQRLVKRSDFHDAYLVLTATTDRKLNDDIYRLCKEGGIYVNVSNDRGKIGFSVPGDIHSQRHGRRSGRDRGLDSERPGKSERCRADCGGENYGVVRLKNDICFLWQKILYDIIKDRF